MNDRFNSTSASVTVPFYMRTTNFLTEREMAFWKKIENLKINQQIKSNKENKKENLVEEEELNPI